MSTLDDDSVRDALADLDGWEFEHDRLVREFRFDDFRAAIDFIDRVADLAEEADHHPELWNVYSRVRLELTSHDAGGVTRRDLDLARAIDAVVAA